MEMWDVLRYWCARNLLCSLSMLSSCKVCVLGLVVTLKSGFRFALLLVVKRSVVRYALCLVLKVVVDL